MTYTEEEKQEIKALFKELHKEDKKGTIFSPLDNFYVKKTKKGYREVKAPIKKDFEKPYSFNNINWDNFLFGKIIHFLFTSIPVFLLVLLVIFSYQHDVKGYVDLLNNKNKLLNYCSDIINPIKLECTPDLQLKGLCVPNQNLSFIGELIIKK